MITIPISVDITGGTAPYTFTYSSSDSDVTFSNVTGTAYSIGNATYSASTDVQYLNQSDIDTAIISVTFVDANGCSTTLSPVVVGNPCDLQSTISTNGEFIFVATTTGGSGSYTYQWNYDTTLFSKAPEDSDTGDNYLSLVLNGSKPLPSSTNIQVNIVDANGCVLYKTYSYAFCRPTMLVSRRLALACDTTPVTGCSNVVSQYRNLDLNPDITLCASQVLDWTTATFNVPVGLCVQQLGNGIITITSNLSTTQTKNITYTVKTTSGITSTTGTITVTIPTCEQGKNPFNGVPQTIQLTADDIVTDEKFLNVESRVAGVPDWSTFTFTNIPSWGTVTFNGNRDIVYEITDITTTPTIPDVIKWSLNDYSGGQINITDTVLRDAIAVPVTVTEVVCNACGETSDPQDLLANDTGSIDRSTVQIVLNDPDIVIVKDTNNNFIFTSMPGASFNNLCSYKVANIQGAYAADQNFFVRVACVGENRTPTVDLTCSVTKTTNIVNNFQPGNNCFGDAFVETSTISPDYTTQGGLITGVGGDLDFTGINPGTYTFEYTCANQGGCSPDFDDVATITIINGETPNITITGVTDNGNNTITVEFDYSGLSTAVSVTLNGNPATFQSGPLLNNGAGILTLWGVSGVNTIVISGISLCGTYISDSDNSITL